MMEDDGFRRAVVLSLMTGEAVRVDDMRVETSYRFARFGGMYFIHLCHWSEESVFEEFFDTDLEEAIDVARIAFYDRYNKSRPT